jgi:protein-tyrosine phosphatase
VHYVTESLLVGNLHDVQQPPSAVSAILFVAENEISPPRGLVYGTVPLREFGEAGVEEIKRAVDWLESHAASHRVMVCCRAGMGRSVSVVIAYLCCAKNMTYMQALQLLKERRPGACPLPNLEQTIEKVRKMRELGPSHAEDHAAQTPSGIRSVGNGRTSIGRP